MKKEYAKHDEEFKTNLSNPTEEDLKEIFNEKFYNYIKKKEDRIYSNLENIDIDK